MRGSDGRFLPGRHYSPATQFKPGQHWREPKPHWNKEWLFDQYVTRRRTSGDIAKDCGCTVGNILYWLSKHGIPRRTISETRSVKRWGVPGAANGMYGKRGALSPMYVDGSSPERQRLYVQSEGKQFLRDILKRDGYRCQRCNATNTGPRTLHVHHLKRWAGHPKRRFDPDNVVTLCRACHIWVHSKANTGGEYLDR